MNTDQTVRNGPRRAEAEQRLCFCPAIDVIETREGFRIVADVPGADPDSIDLGLDGGVLTLTARVAASTHNRGRLLGGAYPTGDYQRSFRLGESIDTAAIAASHRDGVLTITLPKSQRAGSHRIPISVTRD